MKTQQQQTIRKVKVKLGKCLEDGAQRAQKAADRTGKPVDMHYQRQSTDGRADKRPYWAYYGTFYPSTQAAAHA